MIEIDRNSWHFKLWKAVWSEKGALAHSTPPWLRDTATTTTTEFPKTLCDYVATLAASPGFLAFWTFLWIVTVVIWLIAASIIWLVLKPTKWAYSVRLSGKRPTPKVKQPSLLWEHIKATKRQVCPLIQLSED